MWTRRHLFFAAPAFAARPTLRISTFSVDVTPPAGSALCYSLVAPAERMERPLLAKGVVLYPSGQTPVVLCAVDWLGIGGESHRGWRETLALSARTTADRVMVHTVHQHDAPGDDDGAARLAPGGIVGPAEFCQAARGRVAAAIRGARPVVATHWSLSQATVEKVASNRRILSPDGKTFVFQRFTACRNSVYCDAPEGVIDPLLKTLSFWDGERPLASLHYYATHPMSFYGKGVMHPDFVGLARESMPGFHVYFTGAAGNIGAGKYNDGAPGNREVLASRIAAAMKQSLATARREAVGRISVKSEGVRLAHRTGVEFSEGAIREVLENPKSSARERASSARYLAWWQQCQQRGPNILLQTLRLNEAGLFHFPGEAFVEYQLAGARELRGQWTAMAAYGDYGPMYIGTAAAYPEKGYETSIVSRVGHEAEAVLLDGLRRTIS